MKRSRNTLLAGLWLAAGAALAQTAPTSGTLTYETMRRLDLANMRVNINGQAVRPGGQMPNGGTFNPPETTEGEESFQFAANWAKSDPQSRLRSSMFMGRRGGGDGRDSSRPSPEERHRLEQTRASIRSVIEETQFTDLTTGKVIRLVTVRPDSLHTETYRTETNAQRPADWQVSGKTKKILGYVCQKATCTIKGQPCTVWFTTDLPFTFSPAPQFTPDKGVVLMIESDDLAYRATKIAAGPVDTARLTPDPNAKPATEEEMREIRRKAMATMRQRRGVEFQPRN